ncbi:glucose-6-phosphate isomerase [Clostridiisalibacter paucivorans]|uniref:glucose-6-phosphate isomerase n=1 Tax=Clostridiisalibacter paucivorans TaxID=408753 RepID=UPI00047D15BB|nr:glucose-6-phosphate isomerase [Clostridiisalibacter paucivorans]
MKNINFDYSNGIIESHEIEYITPHIIHAHKMLHNKTVPGNNSLGWIDYPIYYDKEEFKRIKYAAQNIRSKSQVFVVIGIGGSYLGARAAIEALSHSFYNQISNGPEIYFAGNNISGTYLKHLLEVIERKDVSLNVISKSGTTTEPAIAFRVLKRYMEKKYGKEETKERIYVTTDKEKGALKTLAEREGYETFVIPDDVGGRFSIFTPVGMLPIAVAGLDIDNMITGGKDARQEYMAEELTKNMCYQYAACRNILYSRGKSIEIMVSYEPRLHYMAEWWKQLYGESEGKDGKGIFPASVNFSTDLHSIGQYLQDGRRQLFETVLNVEEPEDDIVIQEDKEDLDGLNYLMGKTMDFVNKKAYRGALLAHVDGGVPNLIINVPKMDEYYFGKLIYFFEKSCAISGYLLGVNPFNQPGVESYKNNMFALLGKPGYEELRELLIKRI